MTRIIEVFKTNVDEALQARQLADILRQHFPGSRVNFDLHDCDKILRIEGEHFTPEKVMTIVNEKGFMCSILE